MSLLLEPLPRAILCLSAAIVSVLSVEHYASPQCQASADSSSRTVARKVSDVLVRAGVCGIVFAFFFAISWRPLYAWGATLSFFAIFTAISWAKNSFFKEPLVFADITLLPLLLRHKDIFYANSLNLLFWFVFSLYVFGASTLFYLFEPHVVPAEAPWVIPIVASVALGPWLALLLASARRRLGSYAAAILQTSDAHEATARLGAFTFVLLDFAAWLGFDRNSHQEAASGHTTAKVAELEKHFSGSRLPVFLVWQSESFYDMRRLGIADLKLPTLDRLRERAVKWGLLGSIFSGGNTVRTEFSVITGIAPSQLGPDANYPYLKASAYTSSAWPQALRAARWKTCFIHPYDPLFYRRHRAIPELGFDDLVMLDAFQGEGQDEVYVSDRRISRRVIDICERNEDKAVFLFVASMENHGPWKAGRVEGLSDPLEIYLRILERTDSALCEMFAILDQLDRPVWVAFYGDHAPLMQPFGKPFPDPRTDYVLVPSGTALRPGDRREATNTEPWLLISDLMASAVLTASNAQAGLQSVRNTGQGRLAL